MSRAEDDDGNGARNAAPLQKRDKIYFDLNGALKLVNREPATHEEKRYIAGIAKQIFRVQFMTCSSGHILKYVNMSLVAVAKVAYRRGYWCDVCRTGHKVGFHSEYCLHCGHCNYDLCMNCAKKRLTNLADFVSFPYALQKNN